MKNDMNQIVVVKRNGKKESVKLEKILHRIDKESYGLNSQWIQPMEIAKKVIAGIYSGVTTKELDKLSIETAASLTTKHPDYSTLAARLAITTLHKDTKRYFSECVEDLYNFINKETNRHAPLVSEEFYNIVKENADELDSAIVASRDFMFDYFGYKTLEKSYLLKIDDAVAERPQYLFMRTALGIHGRDIESVLKTYDLISQGYFTHATPTLFNAGTTRPQLSSCFLLKLHSDSIEGIFETIKDTALISKNAGGIGIAISNVRAAGSYITGTNGRSNGLIPFLKIFDSCARAVDQCFLEGTKIVTNKGLVEINNLKEGDLVLTSDGKFNPVETKLSFTKETARIVKIKTAKGEQEVTEEHNILVIQNIEKDLDKETIKKRILTGLYPIEWKKAKDLVITDRILKY